MNVASYANPYCSQATVKVADYIWITIYVGLFVHWPFIHIQFWYFCKLL